MYGTIFKHSITNTLAYRFGVFVRILTLSLMLTVMYFVFKAYYAGIAPGNAPVDFRTLISYIALAQFVGIVHWSMLIVQTGERVRNGKIAMELLRPYDYQTYQLAVNAGNSVSTLLTTGVPVFILYVLIFRAGSAFTPATAALFLLSMALSFLVRFYWNYIVSSLTFYVENAWGLSVASAYFVYLFAGQLIPYPLIPEPFHTILAHSPFAAMLYTPVGIGTGIISGSGILSAFLMQAAWIAILALAGRFLFSRASRAITLHGG